METLVSSTAAFTGHRDVRPGHFDLIIEAVYQVADMVDTFVVGGASGADTIALNALCMLAELGGRSPQIVVVVPHTIEVQPEDAKRMIRSAILLGADVIEMKIGLSAQSYKARNQVMVDKAVKSGPGSLLLSYYNNISRSGTAHAMNYARGRGLPIKYVLTDFPKAA